ncbi:MAG TPA: protein kinase [Burkholderiales bacterium]|nr:protein kinase [Burkholderiales bacterium]
MAAQALPAGYGLQEYRIERVLGAGGFGLTYLATDENLNLRVAVKEYLPGEIALRGPDHSITPASGESAETFSWGKRRFLDESRTLASFRHPNIVRVMRFFEANGSAYMVMEFVEGAPLADWIKTRRPLAEAALRALVAPLLEGLEVVHKAGYTHRDIKPGNIYMREDGSPVLLDFGSARMQASELTAVVSPGYAPIEQYHTQGNQGPWSDVYAFGGVLYWIVTGNRPHEAAARVRQDTMPPALQAGDRKLYSAELLAAIDWALAPAEDQRPQSVAQWRSALLGGESPAGVAPQPATTIAPAVATPAFDPVLLRKLEAELAAHLGPIAPVMVRNAAKKAKTQVELIPLLAAEIADDRARAAFEKKFVEVSKPASQPVSAPSGPTSVATVLAASRFPVEVLDRAESRLAEHIGAVARVVVKRAAMKARDEAELYLLIADEIDDREQKKAFIRKAASIARGTSGKP